MLLLASSYCIRSAAATARTKKKKKNSESCSAILPVCYRDARPLKKWARSPPTTCVFENNTAAAGQLGAVKNDNNNSKNINNVRVCSYVIDDK